jgi:hypothetical protein
MLFRYKKWMYSEDQHHDTQAWFRRYANRGMGLLSSWNPLLIDLSIKALKSPATLNSCLLTKAYGELASRPILACRSWDHMRVMITPHFSIKGDTSPLSMWTLIVCIVEITTFVLSIPPLSSSASSE